MGGGEAGRRRKGFGKGKREKGRGFGERLGRRGGVNIEAGVWAFPSVRLRQREVGRVVVIEGDRTG